MECVASRTDSVVPVMSLQLSKFSPYSLLKILVTNFSNTPLTLIEKKLSQAPLEAFSFINSTEFDSRFAIAGAL